MYQQQKELSVTTTDNHRISLKNIYKNSSAFLILSGPSFKQILDSREKIQLGTREFWYKDALKYPGFLTMGVNNSVKSFRPNLWTCVDDPDRFIKSVWLDPKIQKFIPCEHMTKNIFDNVLWAETSIPVSSCPNVFGIERNNKFNAENFLTESTFNWGDHKDFGGGRSVMLIAIKLMYYLGIRQIYLLGCDFKMDEDNKYHFKQDRTKQAIKNNNNTYVRMIERFDKLRPIFDKAGLNIYNCNKNSELKSFKFIDFHEAILKVYEKFNVDIRTEKADGLYDRKAKIKNGPGKAVGLVKAKRNNK